MTAHPTTEDKKKSAQPDRWAPWWIYLIVLLGANYIRAYLLPGDNLPVVIVVAIALGQAAALFFLTTLLWRLSRRSQR
jgi:hypothetical protein